jgi:hypothetical protein
VEKKKPPNYQTTQASKKKKGISKMEDLKNL